MYKRQVEAEERAAKAAEVWANIEENKRYTGTVKSLTSYGAFVDIGGVDGMVHISELSWSRIKHPLSLIHIYYINLDLKPALDEEKLDRRLLRDFEENANRDFHNVLEGLVPRLMAVSYTHLYFKSVLR